MHRWRTFHGVQNVHFTVLQEGVLEKSMHEDLFWNADHNAQTSDNVPTTFMLIIAADAQLPAPT
jgi:hypothetical protein